MTPTTLAVPTALDLLAQRVLHDAHERAAIRRDGEAFHAAVGLTARHG